MKELRRIILVHWYLFEALQVEVTGNVAVIGANGSGKSSLVDAIQTTLFGGNQHMIRLNASAGEKSHRSIRDYCLGVVRDPKSKELTADLRPRETALTYLALVFEDTDTHEPCTVGLCMSAVLKTHEFNVEGRFVLPGAALCVDDFIEKTAEAEHPRDWAKVKADLGARSAHFAVFRDAAKYVRRVTEVLSPDGVHHFDPERFARNFQNAVTFTYMNNVSDFFHKHILPPNPIDVRELQQSMQSYIAIRDKTVEVGRNIADLSKILDLYGEAGQWRQKSAQHDWIEAEACVRDLEARTGPAHQARRDRVLEKRDARRRMRQIEASIADLGAQRMRLNISLEASDTGSRLRLLEAQRERLEQERKHVRAQLADALKRLMPAIELERHAEHLQPAQAEALRALAACVPADGGEGWPADPDRVLRVVAELAPQLSAIHDQLGERTRELAGELRLATDRAGRIENDLRHLKENRMPVTHATRRLIDVLSRNGIEAVPLCNVIEVSDESWRQTIEGILRGNREALLVEGSRVEDALRIYREEGKRLGIAGARIINTRQTPDWIKRCQPGSLAELIATVDPDAKAYVNRMLGAILRASTEKELAGDHRAATADGMYATNGTVTRLQPVDTMLGGKAVEQQRERLEREVAEQGRETAALRKQLTEIDGLNQGALGDLRRNLRDYPDVKTLRTHLAGIDRELAQVAREEKSLNKDKVTTLRKEIAAIDARVEKEKEALAEAKRGWEKAVNYAASLKAAERALRDEVATAKKTRASVLALGGFDMGHAEKRLDILLAKHKKSGGGLAALRAEIRAAAHEHRSRAARIKELARQSLQAYVMRQSRQLADIPGVDAVDPDAGYEAWARDTLKALRDTTLADYQEQAQQALEEARQSFRSGFILGLRENLRRMEDSLEEINRNLRTRPFHGEFYTFVREVNPEYKDIVDLIERIDPTDEKSLEMLSSGDETGPFASAMKRVTEMLMDEAAIGGDASDLPLADYRNYYNYDVVMKDAKGRNPVRLSYRLRTGSGGENQSPFYVAIGTALAATYRIQALPGEEGRFRSGMTLALFDEAFSKLDLTNAVNALDFLRGIGMQVMLAAPNEKYALMAGQMDTLVHVYRDGGAVRVETEYPTEQTRRLLNADLPPEARSRGKDAAPAEEPAEKAA